MLSVLLLPATFMGGVVMWLTGYHLFVTYSVDTSGTFVGILCVSMSWLWVWGLSYAAGCFLGIVQDTGSGNDEVESWPEGDWRDGVFKMLYVGLQLSLSLAAAWVLSWPVGALVEPSWRAVAFALAVNFIFPLFMLSSMEADTLLSPYSPVMLGSLLKTPAGWLAIYLESLLVLGLAFGLLATSFPSFPKTTVVLAAPVLATVIFIDARLYGRLAWHIGQLSGGRKARRRKKKAKPPAALDTPLALDPRGSAADPAVSFAKANDGTTAEAEEMAAEADDQGPPDGSQTLPATPGSAVSPGVAAKKKKKKKKKTGWAAIDSRTRKRLAGVAGAAVLLCVVLCLWLSGVFSKSVTLDEIAGTYVSDKNPGVHEISVSPNGTCKLSKSERNEGGALSANYDYNLTLAGSRLKLEIPEEFRRETKIKLQGLDPRMLTRLPPSLYERVQGEFGELTYLDDYILSSKLGRFSRVKDAATSDRAQNVAAAAPAQKDATAVAPQDNAAAPPQHDAAAPPQHVAAAPTKNPLLSLKRSIKFDPQHLPIGNFLTFTADGRLLCAGGVWDATTGREIARLEDRDASDGLEWIVVSSDGRTMAAASYSSDAFTTYVTQWDVTTGKSTSFEQGGDLGSVALSPDGKMLSVAVSDGGEHSIFGDQGKSAFRVSRQSFTPDGKYLVTAGSVELETEPREFGLAQIWDVTTQRIVSTIRGPGSSFEIYPVSHSSFGKSLALISSDGSVRLLDGANWQEVARLQGSAEFAAPNTVFGRDWMSISPDARTLAVAKEEGIELWDVATGQLAVTLNTTHSADSGTRSEPFAFSPNGKLLAWSKGGDTINLYDVAASKEIVAIQGHAGNITGLGFSPDGTTLASVGAMEPTIKLWDIKAPQATAPVTAADSAWQLTGRAVAPKARLDPARGDGLLLHTLKSGRHDQAAENVVFSPNGKLLASTTGYVWDVTTGEEVAFLDASNHFSGSGTRMIFSPDSQTLAASFDGATSPPPRAELVLWDVAHWRNKYLDIPQDSRVEALAFRPDGKLLAAGLNTFRKSPDGGGEFKRTIALCDVATSTISKELEFDQASDFGFLAFSPDGASLVAGGPDKVASWDLATFKTIAELRAPKGPWFRYSESSSQDASVLPFARTNGSVSRWDGAGWKRIGKLKEFDDPDIANLWFSSDANKLAVRKATGFELWDVARGTMTAEFPGASQAVAFSPDGKLLAWGDEKFMIKLRDLDSAEEVALGGHTGSISGLTFSPDGTILASTAADQTVRLWNVEAAVEKGE